MVNLDNSSVKIRKFDLLGKIHTVIKYDNINILIFPVQLMEKVVRLKSVPCNNESEVIEPPNISQDLKCFNVFNSDIINYGFQANTQPMTLPFEGLYSVVLN